MVRESKLIACVSNYAVRKAPATMTSANPHTGGFMGDETPKGNYAEIWRWKSSNVNHFRSCVYHNTRKCFCQGISHNFHALWREEMGLPKRCLIIRRDFQLFLLLFPRFCAYVLLTEPKTPYDGSHPGKCGLFCILSDTSDLVF